MPRCYLEAFTAIEQTRHAQRVWRFDRISGDLRLIGIRDAEVVKDIYTIYRKDGTPDIGIEDELLCSLEGAFCNVRDELKEPSISPTKDQWADLTRFVAAQLLRTPRALQMMRDYFDAEGLSHETDSPQRVMVALIDRWIPRLTRMNGVLAFGETGLPLLTSDNPAFMWKKQGTGFVSGVHQTDPDLLISCPLSPNSLFFTYQTPASLNAVLAEQHDVPKSERKAETFGISVSIGGLPDVEVKRQNLLCVSNAHRYVYSNDCSKPLLNFLDHRFFGQPGPVRARDLQPVGSPATKNDNSNP